MPPVLVPPTGRLSDDEARAARLAVPYVGPDPAPSRIAGRVVIGVLVVAIVSRLAAAVVFLQRASLEGQMADQLSRRVSGQGFDPAAYDSAAEALAGNRHTAAVIGVTYLLVVLGIIVTFFLWRDQRRPKDVLAAHGETHVESPLRWIQTGSQRLVLFGAIMASLFVGLLGSASAATSYAELHDKRMWSALACLGWAGVWALQILVVLRSERAHAERLAASAPYRAGQLPTPIFAPLANGDRPAQTGESEGLLWILRSAGLFLAGLISGGILIGAIAEHTLESLPFIVVAAPVFGLVVRAYVRRFQRKAARRAAKAAAPPAYAGYPGSW